MTYCLRSARPLSELASTAAGLGWKNAVVASNGRTTPEGVRLHWQWLAPAVDRFGLAFPFFIDWLDSPHPAESLNRLSLNPKFSCSILRSDIRMRPVCAVLWGRSARRSILTRPTMCSFGCS